MQGLPKIRFNDIIKKHLAKKKTSFEENKCLQ